MSICGLDAIAARSGTGSCLLVSYRPLALSAHARKARGAALSSCVSRDCVEQVLQTRHPDKTSRALDDASIDLRLRVDFKPKKKHGHLVRGRPRKRRGVRSSAGPPRYRGLRRAAVWMRRHDDERSFGRSRLKNPIFFSSHKKTSNINSIREA